MSPGDVRGGRLGGRTQRVLVLAACLMVGVIGFGLSRVSIDTGIDSFIPDGDPTYDALVKRDSEFGGDPIVVILHGKKGTQGVLLDSKQLISLIKLEGRLSRIEDVAVVYGPGTVLNQTAGSIRNVLATISGRRDALMNEAEEKARSRGAGPAEIAQARDLAVVDFDRRYVNLLIKGMPIGLPTVRNPQFVASVLLDRSGTPRGEWSFLVPDAKSATILIRPREGLDQSGSERLTAEVRRVVNDAGLAVDKPIVTGVPVLTSSVADRVRTEAPILGATAILLVGIVLMVSRWTPRRRDRLRPLLAAVLGTATTVAAFGLVGVPLSLGAVAFLPIVLGIGSDFPLYLSQPMRRRRVLAAAGAAIVAFASLAVSPLPFVREFGIALALGLLCTVGWAMVLRRFLPEVQPTALDPKPVRLWKPQMRLGFAAVGCAVAVVGFALMPSLQIASNPEDLASGLAEVKDFRTAERELGFAGEVSLVLTGPDVLSPAAVTWQREASDAMIAHHGDQVTPLLTTGKLLDFLGPDADGSQITSAAELLPSYIVGGVIAPDRKMASSSFGVTIDDVAAQQTLLRAIEGHLPEPPAGYKVEVVGLPAVAAQGLELMETSRYLVNGIGMLAAGLVLAIGLRSRRTALMALLAAFLSGGWVLAVLRLLGADLNPLTLAIGALTTVTACEFTVMFTEAAETGARWVRRGVTTAAVAGTVGYLCLAGSQLEMLRTFGLTLAAAVVSSFVAANVVVAAVAAIAERRDRVVSEAPDSAASLRREAVPVEVGS